MAAKGEEYRNKEAIPGYQPGALIIRVTSVQHVSEMVSLIEYVTVESNMMRHGPYVGLFGTMTLGDLETGWEHMAEGENLAS